MSVQTLFANSPQIVSYGDVTCILCSELKGLVTADPGISNALFMDEQANFRDRLAPHALKGSIFSVTPKYEYTADKAYKKRLEKVKSMGKKITEHNWRRKLDRSDPLYRDLAADQGKLAEELESNKVETRRREGTPLVYGAAIQLQLAGSNKFVTQTKNRARMDKLAMLVELVDGGGDGSWWIVTDKEAIRQEGDVVRYCDKICLKNHKFQQSYFYVSSESVIRKDSSQAQDIQISTVYHTSVKVRYEVNASASICQLEFFPFTSWADTRVKNVDRGGEENQGVELETAYIHGGDTVSLSRKSVEGPRFLFHKSGMDAPTWGVEADVVYPWDFGNLTFEEVEATAITAVKARRLLPGTMWRVKLRQMEMGGGQLGKRSNVLVLQNVASGQYLAARDNGEVYMTADLHLAECTWKIECRGGRDGPAAIKSQQPIWFLYDGLHTGAREEQRWLGLQYEAAEDDVQEGQVEPVGQGVRRGARQRATVKVASGEAPKDTDVLEIKLTEVREADRVDYVRRCLQTLSCVRYRLSQCEPMPEGLEDEAAHRVFRKHVVRDLLSGEMRTLTTMLGTISNACTISSDEDPMTRGGPANVEQQNLVREMGFMEAVVELLQLLHKTLHLPMRLFKTSFLSEWRICRLGYMLIEKACTANRLSKSRMQEHVPSFMAHISFEVGSYFTWMAVYAGNRELLVKVTEADVQFSLGNMERFREDRVVNYLIEATHFEADPIKANQEMICRLLFDKRPDLLFRLEATEGDFVFHTALESDSELRTVSVREVLSEAEGDIEAVDEALTAVELPSSAKLRRLRYYLKVMTLMGRVAKGADTEVKEQVLKAMARCQVEPAHAKEVVSAQWMPSSLRAECLTLWCSTLVVGDPSSKPPIATGTRVWAPTRVRVEKEEARESREQRTLDANALAREMEEGWSCPAAEAEAMRTTLLAILRAERSTDVDMAGKNAFARVVLVSLHELVSFGHFHVQDLEFEQLVPDFEKIREMADALIPLLDGRDDVCAPFGGWDKDVARFHLNERTQIVMEAKLKVMEILQVFFVAAHEERWTRFVRTWTRLLSSHFSITDWNDTMQAIFAHANGGPVPYTTPPGPNGGRPSLRATFSRPSKVAPSFCLTDFTSGKKDWIKDAPWTTEEIKELAEVLFGDPPIISDFFAVKNLNTMYQRGNQFFLPEWVSLLLDLVQYDSNRLKEKALGFLIATFNAHANFVQKLLTTQVVTSPDIAKVFFAVKREMGILRNHIPLLSATDNAQREKGFLVVESIVRHWTTILTYKRPAEMTSGLQKIISDLGADDVAARILFTPFKRVRGAPGKLDTVLLLNGEPGERLIKLFTNLYYFLSALADGHPQIQNRLIKYVEWKDLHLGIEGLDLEFMMAAVARDNYEIVKRVGTDWIDTFFAVMEQYKYRHAKMLGVLEPLIKCNGQMIKEHQSLVSIRFRQCEQVVGYFMTEDDEWELRLHLLKEEHPVDYSDLLSFHISVVRLLATTSEGRSPSSEVYAARYLSFKDACKAMVFMDCDNSGKRHEVLPHQLYRVRAVYTRFLHNVYADTRVDSLLDELHEVGNGLWLFEDSLDCNVHKYEPLMKVLEDDVRLLTDMVKRREEKDEACLAVLHSYIFAAVLPFLTSYFSTHYVKVKGRTYGDDEVRAHALFGAVEALLEQGLPEDLEVLYVHREPIDCLKRCGELLKAMSQKGRVREDWAQRDRARPREVQRVETDADRHVQCWTALSKSYESLYETLSKHVGISDTRRMISRGTLQLAMLMARRGEIPIYNNINFLDKGRSTPKNPTYDDFLFAILAISRAGDRIAPSLLTDILRVLRASIYTFEPNDPDRTLDEVKEHWNAFLFYEPVRKTVGPPEETLAWVQNRFDALGCTTAALRLMGSANRAVQLNAIALLMTLLQGGNPRVQRTVLAHLRLGRDTGFFPMSKNVLEHAMAELDEFRRLMKKHKVGYNNGLNVAPMIRKEAGLERGMNLTSFGRGSLVVMSLRLMQLLCKRHFRPLQSILLSQSPALVSHNLIRACVTLLVAAAPLLEDSLEYNLGEVAVLCMQIFDTLAEAAQGPNMAVGYELYNSGVLAVICKVLQCTGYVSLALDRKKACGYEVSANDIKAWLRRAALRCMLAILEGVQDGKTCEEAKKYIDLRLLCSQLVQSGRLIGQVRPSDMSDDDMASAVLEEQGDDFVQNASLRLDSTGRGGSILGGRSGSIAGGSMIGLGGGETNRRLPPPTEMGFAQGWEKSIEHEVFKIYFVLLQLQEFDRSGEVSAKLSATLKSHSRLRTFLTTYTSFVEILRRLTSGSTPIVVKAVLTPEAIVQVFFRLNKGVKALTEGADFRQRTEESLFDVPRSNPQEKAEAFFHKLRFACNRIKWLMSVTKSPVRRIFVRFRDVLDKTPIFISVLITIMLLFCYGIPVDPNTGRPLAEGKFYTRGDPPAGYEAKDYPYASATSHPDSIGRSYGTVVHESDLALKHRLKLTTRWESEEEWELWPEAKIIIYLLSALHVLVSACNATVYLVQDLPLVIFESIDKWYLRTQGCIPWVKPPEDEDDEEEQGNLLVGVQRRRRRLTGRAYLRAMPEPPEEPGIQYSMELYWELLRANNTTFYVALNLAISVLGLTSSPFFFVLQLLDYFRMRDGRLVLRSIIVGGPNLFRSFVLGIIVIVCFGFYSYTYFSTTVNIDQEQCHSPWQCVTKHILDSMTGDLTTVLGTDLGVWAFSAIVPWEDLWKTWRTFFVFISLIFWVFLLQGIIQGQIIDAFAEMRTESNKAKEDLEQKCFVSSLERYAFADFPGEWERRRGGKFAWNYLHFASYLQTEDPDEFDGHELSVFSAYSRLSAEFLPVGVFFASRRAEEDDSTAKELDTVNNRLINLEQAVGRLGEAFQKEMKKLRMRHTMGSAVEVMQRPPRTNSMISSEVSMEDVGSDGVTRTESVESPTRTLPQPPDSNDSTTST